MFPHHYVADSASFLTPCALLQPFARQEEEEDGIVRQAIAILEKRLFQGGPVFAQPTAVADYLRLQLAAEPNEVFAVLFLDAQNRAISFEPLFKGSVKQTSVYPRVVVQRALLRNAVGVILAHCHPSGRTEPSEADRALTQTLRTALLLVDVRVLDHLILGEGKPFSFSEHGLL
jgi:DNA repair protein RadC